jgi:ectoine hydroxylase-related dioxygenase (phytanoyl-CoA dioxygenase family)
MTSPQWSLPQGDVQTREPSVEALRRSLAEEGYVVLPGVVDGARLSALDAELVAAFDRAARSGELFRGGGTLHGHLNCFPGAGSRFVHDALRDAGVLDIVRHLSGRELRAPNVGCNFNLPGSHAQNEHADGYAATPFLVVNVAVVDTDVTNGAMEVLRRTHDRTYRYWEILVRQPERFRLRMRQGDVVIRTSMLWHRGMPNRSARPRPMLAFTWENDGSSLADPYAVHGGAIAFLPNRFATNFSGRLREQAFVAAPHLASAVRAVRSLF